MHELRISSFSPPRRPQTFEAGTFSVTRRVILALKSAIIFLSGRRRHSPELSATWQDDAADGINGYAESGETIAYNITVSIER